MQRFAQHRVEQRLLSKPVARHQDFARPLVVDGEREHAFEMVDAVDAEFLVGVHDGFGVGTGAELMAPGFEPITQLVMVVDLTIECDPDGAVLVRKRLPAAGAIDDRQAAVSEPDEGIT